jgi:hypothetical protein
MEMPYGEAVVSGVVMYVVLFGLMVFGAIAFHVGYKTLGIILICGIGALLAALVSGVFPL